MGFKARIINAAPTKDTTKVPMVTVQWLIMSDRVEGYVVQNGETLVDQDKYDRATLDQTIVDSLIQVAKDPKAVFLEEEAFKRATFAQLVGWEYLADGTVIDPLSVAAVSVKG